MQSLLSELKHNYHPGDFSIKCWECCCEVKRLHRVDNGFRWDTNTRSSTYSQTELLYILLFTVCDAAACENWNLHKEWDVCLGSKLDQGEEENISMHLPDWNQAALSEQKSDTVQQGCTKFRSELKLMLNYSSILELELNWTTNKIHIWNCISLNSNSTLYFKKIHIIMFMS